MGKALSHSRTGSCPGRDAKKMSGIFLGWSRSAILHLIKYKYTPGI
jgi:hypothetical protein